MLNTNRIWIACLVGLVVGGGFWATDCAVAVGDNVLLSVFSESTAASEGNFIFSQTTATDLSGSTFGFGLDENDVYHAALKHSQSSGPANRDWEIRIGQGGQIYSIRSEVGEIVPPQSRDRPFNDEVFQAISVDTSPRNNVNANSEAGEAAFYHQSGYYRDSNNSPQPTFAPLLASGAAEPNSYSTLSLAVQADTTADPQLPSGLLNYQRTRDLGDGVIEITHSIYNFGQRRVNFHNLPWGGVRKTVFDNMLVSDAGGGFTDQVIDDFGDFQNQVVNAEDTGGWAAFTEGTAGTDRGLAYVFGDTDTHLDEDWQVLESSWRWGDGGGDFLGFPVRDFNVGTFRREVNVDPGDLFESRYFVVLGDVDHIESTINARDLVDSAIYDKITIEEVDSELLAWRILNEDGVISVASVGSGQASDFRTFAKPINGSQPLFLFEDELGNEIISIDPYALSDFPYDGETIYKGVLGFVLPTEIATGDSPYVDLTTLFPGGGYLLNTTPDQQLFALQGEVSSIPEPNSALLLMAVASGLSVFRRRFA